MSAKKISKKKVKLDVEAPEGWSDIERDLEEFLRAQEREEKRRLEELFEKIEEI